jgi:hypothetical protein
MNDDTTITADTDALDVTVPSSTTDDHTSASKDSTAGNKISTDQVCAPASNCQI